MKAPSSELSKLAQDCENASAFNAAIDGDIELARFGVRAGIQMPKYTFSRDVVRYLRPEGMTGMEVYPPSEDYPDWAVHIMGPWGHTEGFAVSEVLAECSACLKAWAKLKEAEEILPFEDAIIHQVVIHGPAVIDPTREEGPPESLIDFYVKMGLT